MILCYHTWRSNKNASVASRSSRLLRHFIEIPCLLSEYYWPHWTSRQIIMSYHVSWQLNLENIFYFFTIYLLNRMVWFRLHSIFSKGSFQKKRRNIWKIPYVWGGGSGGVHFPYVVTKDFYCILNHFKPF